VTDGTTPSNLPRGATTGWLKPRTEHRGLIRYVEVIRERIWVVVIITAITTAAAVAYVSIAPKVYKATSQLLITPVSSSDSTYSGLGLIRDSNDPTNAFTTAAALVTTTPVAQSVKASLGLSGSPQSILAKVSSVPLAQSSLVAITASASTPTKAAEVANAFAQAAVAIRTHELHQQLDVVIPPLRARVAALPPAERTGTDSLGERLAILETLRSTNDPTITLETPATAPHAPSSPRVKLTIIAGIFAGLILGIGGAFGLQALDPRLRREEQLRELYSLPVLARIPKDPAGRKGNALDPKRLSPQTVEAFRTLRAMLMALHPSNAVGARSIFVTSASVGEGKTTTSINLAYSLAQQGHRTILMEADFRRPTIGATLGLAAPRIGIESVLVQQARLEDALFTVEGYGEDLKLLLVERAGDWMVDRLSLPTAGNIVREAAVSADYVVIDSPPLTEVIDALPLARLADDVVLVTRLGKTNLRKLEDLGELLAQNGITPVGAAIVGVERSSLDGYYQTKPSRQSKAEARRPESSLR
jgi:polysaccharide biosynthesis transport protein